MDIILFFIDIRYDISSVRGDNVLPLKNLYRLLMLNCMHLIEYKYNFCMRGQLPIQVWKKKVGMNFTDIYHFICS